MKLLKELNEAIQLNEGWQFTKAEVLAMEKRFENSQETDEDYELAYEFVVDHDPTWMPYGTQKARTGDPHEWIGDHIDEIIEYMLRAAKDA